MKTSRSLYPFVLVLWFTLGLGCVSHVLAEDVKVYFHNLTNQTLRLPRLVVTNESGQTKTIEGNWTFEPGARAYLLYRGEPIRARKASYTVEFLEGRGSWKTEARKVGGEERLLLCYTEKRLAEDRTDLFSKPHLRKNAEQIDPTLKYYLRVQEIFLEEWSTRIYAQAFEFNRIANGFNNIRRRVLDTPTQQVDVDLVRFSKEELCEWCEMASDLFRNRRGGKPLVDLVIDWRTALREMERENRPILKKEIRVYEQAARVRLALPKVDHLPQPYLLPPVIIVLEPFVFSKGYYVHVLNVSGHELKDVELVYTEASGKIHTQRVSNIDFMDSEKVDPDDIDYRVDPDEHITVRFQGGAYTFPTNMLIR